MDFCSLFLLFRERAIWDYKLHKPVCSHLCPFERKAFAKKRRKKLIDLSPPPHYLITSLLPALYVLLRGGENTHLLEGGGRERERERK